MLQRGHGGEGEEEEEEGKRATGELETGSFAGCAVCVRVKG